MTHTNEFLRGMFAAYMGCEVFRSIMTFNVVGFSRYGLVVKNGAEVTDGEFEHCKPILTPLSEITDEDAVEVAKILYGSSYNVDRLAYVVQVAQTKDLIQKCKDTPLMHIQWISVIDYLRSPYRPDGTPKPVYDCGYMHIQSLIAADLAISSKQI